MRKGERGREIDGEREGEGERGERREREREDKEVNVLQTLLTGSLYLPT